MQEQETMEVEIGLSFLEWGVSWVKTLTLCLSETIEKGLKVVEGNGKGE
jgi:hypothetical protein